MNQIDYGSRPMCQKLVDAGVVLKTETVWRFDKSTNEYFLTTCNPMLITTDIPAPSLAEVERELPFFDDAIVEYIESQYDESGPWLPEQIRQVFSDVNRAINLLIWTVQRKEK